MNFKSALFVLGLISEIYAAKFAVVSFNGDCEVNINGQSHKLQKEKPNVPRYVGEIDVPLQTKYKYVCGGKSDEIERTLTENTTHNELFGRALTTYDMPEFKNLGDPWGKTIGRTELFDPDYVPIVIVDGGDSFFKSGAYSGKFSGITFVLKDSVFTFNDITVFGKNQDEDDKFQFQVTLPGEGIYGRNNLKFRPNAFDPIFFRQILYGDIAHAIGNPTHESVSARVYLNNGTGIGLYVLQEDCTSESFVKATFFGDPQTQKVVGYEYRPVYDCSTGADFTNNSNSGLGSFQNKINGEEDHKEDLSEMISHIDALNVLNDAEVENIDKNWLDLDTLFKALALEYLTGHWDSFWFMTSNFVTYHPFNEEAGSPGSYTKYKYYFVDQDFDQTFGVDMKESLDPHNYPTKSYTTYVNKGSDYWHQINADEGEYEPGTRAIVNKFLGCDNHDSCSTKTRFENHLKAIVQHVFNPIAMKAKLDGYKDRLSAEVEWDTGLQRVYHNEHNTRRYTFNDFKNNFEGPAASADYGILDWTTAIANTVCKEFNIKYDEVPLVSAGSSETNLNTSSSSDATSVRVTAGIIIASILSVVLLL